MYYIGCAKYRSCFSDIIPFILSSSVFDILYSDVRRKLYK